VSTSPAANIDSISHQRVIQIDTLTHSGLIAAALRITHC
jgi:hypothetical protein